MKKLLVKKSIQLANTSKLKHSPRLTESFEMFLLKIDCFPIVAEYCYLMLRCSNQLLTYLRSFTEKNGWNEMLVDSPTSTTKTNEEACTSTKCSSIQPSQWTALPSLSSSPTRTVIVVVTCDKTRQTVCEGGPYHTRRGPRTNHQEDHPCWWQFNSVLHIKMIPQAAARMPDASLSHLVGLWTAGRPKKMSK